MVKVKNAKPGSALPLNLFRHVNQHDHGIDLLDPEQVRALYEEPGKGDVCASEREPIY